MGQSAMREESRFQLGQAIFSRHAELRSRQRAISSFVIDALQDFGDSRSAGEGCESFYFTNKSWKRFIAYMGPAARGMEKYRHAYVIVAADGTIVTEGWRH